ncbi:hypothetical protein FACS1894206_03980 [Deltaproteobacteria bacterium]|nr:hypothetical protein FACS1894206_03980 [Deltaproteobacteria bacterium]
MVMSPAMWAIGKIILAFAFMLFAISRKWSLWLAILSGGLFLALLFNLSFLDIGAIAVGTLVQPDFLSLFSVVICILLLSAVQGSSGQGQRLVAGLRPYIKSARLRLIFFPALIGLLPMPGGAIFSCPMVQDVADELDMTERHKVLINYWFRHIWESVWPLYPGYILACSLANIPLLLLWRYTFPFIFISVAVGWFLLLRIPIKTRSGKNGDFETKKPLASVLAEALPIITAIAAAPLYGKCFALFGIIPPNGAPFVCSFLTATCIALKQNSLPFSIVPRLLLQRQTVNMLALVLMIFFFKELVIAANVVDALATILSGKSAMLVLFFFLPFLMGILTGLMLGFVGAAFPLLIGLLEQAGMYDERLCWIMLGLFAGNFGQMLSPLHSCYLVTLEFFKVPMAETWRSVSRAAVCQIVLSAGYAIILYYTLHPLL